MSLELNSRSNIKCEIEVESHRQSFSKPSVELLGNMEKDELDFVRFETGGLLRLVRACF